MKKISPILASVLLIVVFTSCKDNTKAYKNAPEIESVSQADMVSDEVLLLGTYDELVARLGEPENGEQEDVICRFTEDGVSKVLKCPHVMLYYDNYYYVQKGDSVQLLYINLDATGATLTLPEDKGGPLVLNSKTSFEEFYYRMPNLEELEAEGCSQESFRFGNYMTQDDTELGYRLSIPSELPVVDTTCGISSDYYFGQNKKLKWVYFTELCRHGLFRPMKVNGEWVCEGDEGDGTDEVLELMKF